MIRGNSVFYLLKGDYNKCNVTEGACECPCYNENAQHV